MKVVITGAAGYIGGRVADALLAKPAAFNVTELILTDLHAPPARADPRVKTVALDITDEAAVMKFITNDIDVMFHLAAVVSALGEANFDLGMKVNFDATRYILEALRKKSPKTKLVFASTVCVFGGDFPPVITDQTAVKPQTSYGTQKAMLELLVNDYSRRGFVDGRVVRLPTTGPRAGPLNPAITIFATKIIVGPLNGQETVCPVKEDLPVWLASPVTVVNNIIHAATLDAKDLGDWRVVALPGLATTVGGMIAALRKVAGDKVANLIRFEYDERIAAYNATLPGKMDNTRALKLGFKADTDYADNIRYYMKYEMKENNLILSK